MKKLLLFACLFPIGLTADVVNLDRGVSILDSWQDGNHVYVAGNLGVSDGNLAGLDRWLDEHAANWTVLLLESAAGERFEDSRGFLYHDIDAVEHAMGKGLPAKTGFGGLKHPATGESNGAFFILFLKDRTFSYYGSTAYERRGLGARNWAGDLDAAAKDAMRNGVRIVEAVQNTVRLVDGRLEKALAREKAAREAAVREAARLKAQVAEGLQALPGDLDTLASELTQFQDGPPTRTGDLARLDLGSLRADLESARRSLDADDVGGARALLDGLSATMAGWRDSVSRYHQDKNALDGLVSNFENLTQEPDVARPGSLAKGRAALARARERHDQGWSDYRDSLDEARRLYTAVQAENREAINRRQIRRQNEAAARRTRNTAIATGGAAGGLTLLLGGLAGNRNRRRSKLQAEQLLALRKQELKDAGDRLSRLLDRSSVVVGYESELPKRSYTGQTLAMAKESIRALDQGFILSSKVGELIALGEKLVQPANPLLTGWNLVQASRYDEAVDLLDAVVKVDSGEGAALIIGGENLQRPGLPDEESFEVELPVWTARLHEAMDRAEQGLDVVEEAWTTIAARCESLAKGCAVLSAKESGLRDSSADGRFLLESTFDAWIPAILSRLRDGSGIAKSDPVTALREPISEGESMADSVAQAIAHVETFRLGRWPDLQAHRNELLGRGRRTEWIDEELDRADIFAEDLGKLGSTGPLSAGNSGPDSTAFGELLNGLADQVALAATSARRADEDLLPRLQKSSQRLTLLREELSARMDLPADRLLAEERFNPDDRFHKAGRQLDEALDCLDLGRIAAAGTLLDDADHFIGVAGKLMDETQACEAEFPARLDELVESRRTLGEDSASISVLVERLRGEFAPEALFVDPGSSGADDYSQSPAKLKEALSKIGDRISSARDEFSNGGILAAARHLFRGEAWHAWAGALCEEVRGRERELAQLMAANGKALDECERLAGDLEVPARDRRVMAATLSRLAEAREALATCRRLVGASAGRKNPFHAEARLKELAGRLEVVRKEIADDLAQHEGASLLHGVVGEALREAGRLAETAREDHIPDSPRTRLSLGEFETLRGRWEEAGKTLHGNHEDWVKLQGELRGIHLGCGQCVISLREELKKAAEAVRSIEFAQAEIARAAGWQGAFGVRVFGRPGESEFVESNNRLGLGDYHGAINFAGHAAHEARMAISRAESEEASRRAAAEAERRRQRQRARASRMGRSSFSGSSFGGTSRSSGRSSGVGRSSFSSGSGVGRSGW